MQWEGEKVNELNVWLGGGILMMMIDDDDDDMMILCCNFTSNHALLTVYIINILILCMIISMSITLQGY